MSKQKTAIEWYIDRISEILGDMVNQCTVEQTLANHYAIKKAKQMERKQHSDTWIDSRVEDKEDDYIGKQKSFDEYFTDTYGKEELLP